MNRYQILVLSLLMLVSTCLVGGQTPGIHIEYMKDNKSTRVETNLLYVYNTPDQFVELMLRSGYKAEKLVKPPSGVSLEIFSLSKTPLYRKDRDRSVVAIADGTELAIGSLKNFVLSGETKQGVDAFYAVDGNPNVGMNVQVPASAKIKSSGNGVNGLSLEWMSLDMKSEQFLTIAKAKTLGFRLGNSSFTFSDGQMNIIRAFVDQITLK